MLKLKIRKIGNSAGVVLPGEMMAKMKVEIGDSVIVTDFDRGFAMTPYDPTLEAGLKAFRRTRRKYRNAFRELAK